MTLPGEIKFRINQDFLIEHSCILHKIKFIIAVICFTEPIDDLLIRYLL